MSEYGLHVWRRGTCVEEDCGESVPEIVHPQIGAAKFLLDLLPIDSAAEVMCGESPTVLSGPQQVIWLLALDRLDNERKELLRDRRFPLLVALGALFDQFAVLAGGEAAADTEDVLLQVGDPAHDTIADSMSGEVISSSFLSPSVGCTRLRHDTS